MDTTILAKRIEEKATNKEKEDFSNFIRNISNSYLQDLRIKVWNEDFSLKYFLCNLKDYKNITTNIEELRDRKRKEYIQSETDTLIKNVGILADYLENPPQY